MHVIAVLLLELVTISSLLLTAMASSDASQLAGALERRLACGNAAERRWADARRELVDAPQLADGRTDGVAELDRTVVDQPTQSPDAAARPLPSDWLAAGTTTGDAAQLSGSITRAPILEI